MPLGTRAFAAGRGEGQGEVGRTETASFVVVGALEEALTWGWVGLGVDDHHHRASFYVGLPK